MKLKKIKVLISLIMSLLLVTISVSSPVIAKNLEEVNYSSFESQIMNYAVSVLPDYLDVSDSSLNITISQPIKVNNRTDSNARMFFVSSGSEYIGQLRATFVKGSFYSSYMEDDNQVIKNALENDIPFALAAEGKALVFQTLDANTVLNNAEALNIGTYLKEAAQLTAVNINNRRNNTGNRTGDYYMSLPVSHVSNYYGTGDGLCWAASTAAVLNYRRGTSYSAYGLYSALDGIYSGTPVGNTTWYERGFLLGNLSCTTVSGGMEFLSLYSQLCSYRPVIFSVANNYTSHAVVLKVLEGGNEYARYGFMDCDWYNTINVNFYDPELDPDNFVYTDGVGSYPDWNYARY